MAALAGGRWVVTRRFVDRSHRQVGVHSHLGFLWLVILVSIDCFGVVFVVKLVFLLINVLYLCHTFNFHCKLIFDNERYMQTPQEVQRVQAQTRREFVLRTQQFAWQRR